MGRIDSTDELKPHEIALRKLSMNKDVFDLILATLGLGEQSVEVFQHLLTTGKVKQLDEVCNHFTPDDFARLPEIEQKHKNNRISGQWVEEDEGFRISNENGYTQKLHDAVINIYPDFMGDEETIPVTILLPSAVQQDERKLEGTCSQWDFITVNNLDFTLREKNLFTDHTNHKSKKAASEQQAKHTLPLRLFFAFKFLGLVDTQQSSRNGSRIFQELARSLSLVEHFNLLDCKELNAWGKGYKEKLKLSEQLHTQQVKYREVANHYHTDSEAQIRRKKTRQDEIQDRCAELKDKLRRLQMPLPRPVSSETKKSFYYTIPESFFHKMDWYSDTESDQSVNFPTLKLKKKTTPKFTSVCLGHAKSNDPTALFRDTDKMRLMLCYLFPMTSGTAITINVKRAEYKESRKTMGITSPTLILPEVWSDLAMGLKQHNSKSKVPSMSDDNYVEERLRADFTSAIHGDYLTMQGEILRLLPTLENEKAIKF